jgi:two-component system LytT family response regulator
MKIRALIVDDEALARGRLRKLLAEAADLEIIGESSNGPEAISFIRERRPDLAFLDVQMPEVSGFDVLRALPEEIWPAVVFVTAHNQHAIEAFEVHALDYLLKPFTQARLLAAVQRARQHLETRNLAASNQQLAEWLRSSKAESAYLSRIAVKTGTQTLFIRVEDLDYIESVGNYALLHTRTENHVLRETLTNLAVKLSPHLFLRISRSILVNLERIKGLQSTPSGEYLVVLHDDRQLMMTRGLSEIRERLQYPETPVGGLG